MSQIPDLSKLGLTPEQRANRLLGIGGSDARILAGGDVEKINQLALEKMGQAEHEDTHNDLMAMLGHFTEPFNVAWYKKTEGRDVYACGEQRVSATYSFARCTLDGLTTTREGRPAVLQCKMSSPFMKKEEIVTKFFPQVTHEMIVLGVDRAILSVLRGNVSYFAEEIKLDEFYAAQLIDTEKAFWESVQAGRLPYDLPKPFAVVEGTVMRQLDMTVGNRSFEWQQHAEAWLAQEAYVDGRKITISEIKDMLPDDAYECFGHGIVASRAKNGAITIRERKEKSDEQKS